MTTGQISVDREDLAKVIEPDCYSFNEVQAARDRLRAALQQPAAPKF